MTTNLLALIENEILNTKSYIQGIIISNTTTDTTTNLITIEENIIDSIILKNEETLNQICKYYSLSILTGEYITREDIIEQLNNIEQNTADLIGLTADLLSIQSNIFELVSTIVVLSEIYKDFSNNINNKYSEFKVEYLFSYNKRLEKELKKETLSAQANDKVDYFFNILKITNIDHFPSNNDQFLFDLFSLEEYFKKSRNLLSREISEIIIIKIKFLKHKWKERRFQDYPLLSNYIEDGQQKSIEDFQTNNLKLQEWLDIINTQYELYTLNWKAIISDRVRKNLGKSLDELNSLKIIELHQLIKYYKDINPNLKKLKEISDVFKMKKDNSNNQNFYNRYSIDLCLNYSLNNEFSKYLEKEKSIENIVEYYDNLNNQLCGRISNYFVQFKYLTRLTELVTPQLESDDKLKLIGKFKNLKEDTKDVLASYFQNKEWSIKNFNYVFSLPFEESLVKFEVDENPYQIFFASSFVLPPSQRNIEEGYTKVADSLKRITSYIDFNLYFSHEINEINELKNQLDKKDFKSIEIISIFTAIITFVLSSIPAYRFIESVWESLLFMLSLSTALSLFITLILFSTRDLYKKWYSYIPLIVLFTLCYFGFNNLLNYEQQQKTKTTKAVDSPKKDIIKQ